MEIKLSHSVRVALDTFLQLQLGSLRAHDDGENALTVIAKPQWSEFFLPSRIVSTPVVRTDRQERDEKHTLSFWRLRREVSFYVFCTLQNRYIATVTLVGQKNDGEYIDDGSWWAAATICYPMKLDFLPERWTTRRLQGNSVTQWA